MSADLAPTQPNAEVRQFVRELLERTPSYQSLSMPERKQIARDMVQVVSYLSDPTAGQPELAEAAAADPGGPTPGEVLRNRLSMAMAGEKVPLGKGVTPVRDPKNPRKQVASGANEVGADTFSDLVGAVDFVGFVSGLIEGVFTSIVNSSIRQMQEYAKFLEAVSKSVQEFANDHVSIDDAQGYLASQFPKSLKLEQTQSGEQRLAAIDSDDAPKPDFKQTLGLETNFDVGDEEGQKKVVAAAQLKLARMRQQQMATMVTMGINRIVVTEGEIKASVMIDVKAKDKVERTTTRDRGTSYKDDSSHQAQRKHESGGGWLSNSSGSSSSSSSRTTAYVSTNHVNSVGKASSEVESNAKLSGYVQVKFKSDYFPLEKMASMQEMEALQEKSKR